ncbi:cyaA [Symbiodinium microadriaticum]|nr:cyaA [Symbiodinium microadriaticum]
MPSPVTPVTGRLVLGKAQLASADGSLVEIQRGTVISVHDEITTQSNGHVHIRFVDNALVSVRPNSRLEIQRYEFNQERPELSAVKFNLQEGVTRSISGDAAKAARERFRLNTPVAAIGVRGTDFIVSTDQDMTRALVKEGIIVMAPYSAACSMDALGPCLANALELAGNTPQMVALEGNAPLPRLLPAQNIRNPDMMQEELQLAIASTEQPSTRRVGADGEGESEQDRQNAVLLEGTTPTVTADAKIAAVAALTPDDFTPASAVTLSDVRDRQLVWGRYADVALDTEPLALAFSEASAGRQITVGDLQYGLFRTENGPKRVASDLGLVGFQLDSAQAVYNSSTGVVAMEVSGGSLNIDFQNSAFETALNLNHDLTGPIEFSAAGRVLDGGFLRAIEATQRIAGAVSLDGKEERITLVVIDEASIAEVGPWPWQREDMARHNAALIDNDGAVRRSPAIICHEGNAYPALSLAAFLQLGSFQDWGGALSEVNGMLGPELSLSLDGYPGLNVPLDESGAMRVSYAKSPDSFLAVSAIDVINGNVDSGMLDNAWALVGVTALGTGDIVPTPYSGAAFGVEVQARLLASLLDMAVPYTPAGATQLLLLMSLIIGAIAIGIASMGDRTAAYGLPVAAFLLPVSALGVHILVLANSNLWLGWIAPALFGFVGSGALLLLELARARFERSRVFGNLNSYLPDDVAREIAFSLPTSSVNAQRKDVTLLNADLRNFSAFGEARPPEEIAAVLHYFFTRATEIIEREGGRVQEFKGDSLLAVWDGANRVSASKALQSAKAMQQSLNDTLLPKQAVAGLEPLALGIGIEQGPVLIGSIGPAHRRSHTLLGDTVSITLRIQEMTAELAQPVLVGESAARQLTDEKLESQGSYLLSGLRIPHTLFALPASANITALAENHPNLTVVSMRFKLFIAVLICLPSLAQAQAQCPDLSAYYPGESPDWTSTQSQLALIFEQCLTSSEYFALSGAALLNSGQLDQAMESLERALMLDPDNGAAMLDYAQALLMDGQLFAAIEANELLLQREDVPSNLVTALSQRQDDWESLTRQTSWQVDVMGGYDDNLNGAPDSDLITLTLSGESVLLGLSPEFQAISGPFLNLRFLGRHRRLEPDKQHNFLGELRGRLSEHSASDLLQLSTRYNLVRADGRNSWQFNSGLNHLFFAGSALFTGTDAGFRYQFNENNGCRPYYSGALQHQLWHEQSRLNGLEAKLGLGSNCTVFGASNQRINGEISVLHNAELKNDRLGGSREGWQFALDWQYALPRGVLSAQYNHTRLRDRRGYSPLLSNNARRDTERNSFLIQYRENFPVLSPSAVLLINLYHQDQSSNLELFRTEDTSIEVGISWRF